MEVLIDKLKDFDYYLKKCPMYLRNSESFVEHFRIFYDLLINEVNASEELLSLINIFDPEYEEKFITGEIPLASDILEKLGNLFNLSHNFSVNYGGNEYQLNLTDQEFLILLKAQIIKNYSNGSYEQMKELYNKLGWKIVFMSDVSANVRAIYITFDNVEDELSENLEHCWKAGLLTIQAMGINYSYSINEYQGVGYWDSTNWDEGLWSL